MRALSLDGRMMITVMGVALCAVAAVVATDMLVDSRALAVLAGATVALLGALVAARMTSTPVARLLRALENAVASFRDGDFSVSMHSDRGDELGDLARMHNQLAQTLRQERQHLVQRELLLDTVVQNTPVALMLVDETGRVAYANLAARQLFNDNRSLGGMAFDDIVAASPAAMREVLAEGGDALFSVSFPEGEETFHLSQRGFRLQGRAHRLYLFRRMTRELSRQEVATWKKVIRVMSHELNNALAPMSSMAHSGAELVRRGQLEKLPQVFSSIAERARHLHRFIEGYAQFARLPAPQLAALEWSTLVEGLAAQVPFVLTGTLPELSARVDAAQLERVLLNLLKNAHEAGSAPDAVELQIDTVAGQWRIEVRDRGSGMSETVLANALLPFYSTKRAGTGLGLALAREIVEAHGGRIQLANRDGGGLRVSLLLPA
jgi:two-component system nitrogen regulation sensor histidine kinase NtrY